MSHDHVIDLLSDYLDNELEPAARAQVDAHLLSCAACAAALDDLRRLVALAGTASSSDAAPARDLWTGIRARIGQPAVGDITAARERRARSRGITLSIGQLAAAAALLMAVSGGTAWYLRGAAAPGAPAVLPIIGGGVIHANVETTATPEGARLANFADAQYDAAIADLERTLDERRNDLNPRTVEILERNLKLIDAAIAQARQALEEDPANAYLNRHLVESRRRKLDLLRRATTINNAD